VARRKLRGACDHRHDSRKHVSQRCATRSPTATSSAPARAST
jgi:hypothetical protein